MKKSCRALLAFAPWVLVGAAQAASVSLSPSSHNAAVGNTVSFDVSVDFSDVATDGGGFRISYDAALLGNADFSYAELPSPISGVWAFDNTPGLLEGVGFDANAFQASTVLGTLSFTVLGAGSTSVDLSDMLDPNWRFLDSDQWNPIDVTYSGASLGLTSAVPVPAALWLMASGLGVLGAGLRRRSR